jgi:hypothetical protein
MTTNSSRHNNNKDCTFGSIINAPGQKVNNKREDNYPNTSLNTSPNGKQAVILCDLQQSGFF